MADGAPPISADDLIRQADWVRRLARALVGSDAEADDLTQEVLSAAIKRPPQPGVPLPGWLAGVTRNLARLRWRSKGRRERHEEQAVAADDASTPEALVERAQAHQLLTKLLLELAEPLRSTLLLRYYEGLSSAEIARRLGVPAGTVRWRLKRALDQLRSRLDESTGPGKRKWALLLGPLSGGPAPSTIARGVLFMKAVKVVIGVVVALLLAWVGVLGYQGRAGHRTGDVTAATRSGRKGIESAAVLPMREAPSGRTMDPVGKLRLEGQVIDEQDRPVAGAEVALDANPTRLVRSGADGSFVFDNLIAREYRVEARSGDGYASPAELRLTATSEPLILRIRRGGTVEVLVRDAASGGGVVDATVELRSMLTWQARTDESGRAHLVGVGAGWPSLRVTAAGYAPGAMMLRTSGDPRRAQHQIMTISRGAAVSGRVIDAKGSPVAGAMVAAEATSEPFPVLDVSRDGVVSGADGRWHFDSLSAGTFRFVAFHDDLAAASTAPIALDGQHALDRVEIRMTPGSTLGGRVVDEGGHPIASALVRLMGRGSLPWRAGHEAFSDAEGRFLLRGLPERQADVSASCGDGSSDLVPLDLTGARRQDVTLTISIRGVIEGLVASPDGNGIPEARVMAEPEKSGALGEREAWQARGLGSLLADGGGRFRFIGMPPGRYRISAVRPDHSDEALHLAPGVAASPGDRNVRVVVPADGRVRGKIVFKEGGSPDLFTVEIDAVRPEPLSPPDGTFELEVPGGKHDLVVTGPTFQRTRVPNVEVKENATTDLGNITVEKGRSVSGRVLDGSGAPVAGALVAGGLLLTGNGSQLNVPSEGYRVQETESDASGRYVLRGFGEEPIVVVAGRQSVGRSASIRVPRGPSSVEVDLVLQPTGSLSGKLTRDGQPLAQAVVIAIPRGARRSNFFVMTGEDGSYAFDSLAAGDYVVSALLGGGNIQPKDQFFEAVTISPGQRAKADLAVRHGTASASVKVLTERGDAVGAALVFVVAGTLSAPNLESMLEGTWVPTGGQIVPTYLRWTVGGTAARIEGLFPGPYSFCAVPLPVDPNDRPAIMAIRDQVDSLPMRCMNAVVRDAAAQSFDLRFTRGSGDALK